MISNHISRRAFIGTGAAASAVAVAGVVPLPLARLDAAVLHGDGRHDDTETLQALFDGRPVRVARPGMVASNENGTVRLLNGTFRTRRPIRASSAVNLYSGHCSFRMGDVASPYPWLDCVD